MIFEVGLEIKKIETTTSFTNKELGVFGGDSLRKLWCRAFAFPKLESFTFFPDFLVSKKRTCEDGSSIRSIV